MKRCKVLYNNEWITFNSYTDASCWVIKNKLSNKKPKTIAMEIKQAIAFSTIYCNCKWEGSDEEEEVLITGINLEHNNILPNLISPQIEIKENNITKLSIKDQLHNENLLIEQQRKEWYEESLGIKNVLYKKLPLYKTKEEILKTIDITQNYALSVHYNGNWYGLNNIEELIILLKINITYKDIYNIIYNNVINEWQIIVNREYKQHLEQLLSSFENNIYE